MKKLKSDATDYNIHFDDTVLQKQYSEYKKEIKKIFIERPYYIERYCKPETIKSFKKAWNKQIKK